MKRFLGLIVLIALVVIALYYWRNQPARDQRTVDNSVAQARNAIEKVGDKIGDKFRQTKIAGEVKAAFELNRDLGASKIDIDTNDSGAVTLKGQVPSERVRALAGRVAAAVPDVTQVTNQLTVDSSLAPAGAEGGRTVGENFDDKALVAKVNLAFSLNRELKGTDLKVQSYQRHLTLGGQVDSESQRQLALEIARQAPSVLDVTDQIAVRTGGAPANPAAPPAGERTRRVEQALSANTSLAAYGIKVREEGGRIVLSGRVRTTAEKDLAGLLARDAAGSAVENTLIVGS